MFNFHGLDEDGMVHQVKCKVCSKIKGTDKLLAPKLDSPWKHDGKRKALVVIPSVVTPL
jgi:hypothetical protein